MTDMSYQTLKEFITASINISSTNLNEIATAFSQLYIHFQTEAIQQVTIEPIQGTCFNWVRAKYSDPKKILLFFHGGGYTMGNTTDHLELLAQLILKTHATVLSVDYRLCPGYLFPAPLEDGKSAYSWLLNKGFKSHEIAFSGISAGGLLVTQLILSCFLDKIPLPKAAIVMSGPSNLKFNATSYTYNADRDWISTERLRNIQNYYIPKKIELNDVLLSPIDVTYTSYPATLFQAGDYELLLDDSILFYQRLRNHKLPVYLDIISGLPHCWQLFAKAYEPGRTAIQLAANFINKQFK